MVTQGFDGRFHKIPQEKTIDEDLKNEGYKLVFEDDFDGNELNPKYWSKDYGKEHMRRGGYYLSNEDTIFLKDSKLVIRTKYKENGEYGPGWYSGWVESAPKGSGRMSENLPEDYEGISYKYGYFEAKVKAPKANGIWGAFWLMPDEASGALGMHGETDIIGTSEDGVEVDIMESVYSGALLNKNTVNPVIHFDAYGKDTKSDKARQYHVPKMYEEFHVYGCKWDEKEYVFYIDGAEVYRTPLRHNGKVYGPSKVKEYMLLTVEMAGDIIDNKVAPGKLKMGDKIVKHWAGNPDKNKKDKFYDFEVDYVKVYRKEEQ